VSGNAGTNQQTFTYDPLRRLTGSSLNGAALGYTYDLDGNRTRTVDGGVTSDYTYDRADQLISQSIAGTPTAFAYDAYGNLTAAATPSATQTVYAYDLGDRLTTITNHRVAAPPPSVPTRWVQSPPVYGFALPAIAPPAWQLGLPQLVKSHSDVWTTTTRSPLPRTFRRGTGRRHRVCHWG
jgi:YD repeat-containing protein